MLKDIGVNRQGFAPMEIIIDVRVLKLVKILGLKTKLRATKFMKLPMCQELFEVLYMY